MNADPLVVDGVEVLPSDRDSSAYAMIPGEPVPERAANGEPTLLLLDAGASSILQFGVHWNITEETMDRIRARIAHDSGVDPSIVQLRWAAMRVDDVVVELTPSSGDAQTLASASSAQYPPYAAIFNLTLASDQATLLKAALNGKRGIVTIRYRAAVLSPALSTPVTRSTDIASWYGSVKPTIMSTST